jgi:hypothetical protein
MGQKDDRVVGARHRRRFLIVFPTVLVLIAGGGALYGGGIAVSLAGYGSTPTVTSISPGTGVKRGGTTVTVTGANFADVTAVSFGSTSATSFTVVSPTSITAISPAGSGTVDVTVTSPGGTSATSASDQFSYPTPAAPAALSVAPDNGGANLDWQSASPGAAPVTHYLVTVTPSSNDRLPKPNPAPSKQVITLSATAQSYALSGLIEDCHQRYDVSVTAENANGRGPAAKSQGFRPSGIVTPGVEPPYVVILIDGINETQPVFNFDPYYPTLDQTEPQGYCPESWNVSKKHYNEADFRGAPNGPWSFFHKWNFGEVDGSGNSTGNHESEPRALEGNADKITVGKETHSFMLDAIAAQGAVVLPFSYDQAELQSNSGGGGGDPVFTFNGYSGLDSTPTLGKTIQEDASMLAIEMLTVEQAWPNAPIVVMGHSQGGLVAWEWWLKYTHPPEFRDAFALDSPINGVCVTIGCVKIASYPEWEEREVNDPKYLTSELESGETFHFIGTYGDPVEVPILGHAYGTGPETLEHQLLFPYNPPTFTYEEVQALCADPSNESGCPAYGPIDHISACPLVESAVPSWEWHEGHYVVKYCPDDVAFVNKELKLQY